MTTHQAPTAGRRAQRGRASRLVRDWLRDRFGIWPLHEARNRALMAPGTWRVRRFEDAEVAALLARHGRLGPSLVTTVIPTFRRPELLLRAVESALAQTVEDNLLLVVDDGGGLPPLPDHPRLRAVSLSRNSAVLGVVRNVGIRLSSSTYVAFLDDDNEWRPDHLAVALDRLEAGADLVYTALERRRSDGTVLDLLGAEYDRRLLADGDNYVDINAVVVRRAPDVLFSRIPRVKATLPKEDWEFVHRLSATRAPVFEPVPTVRYLVNDGSYYTDWTG
ncbi:glycosyltransferase family 2 protein [Blastococcus deserti]|uniref:Glycosyltransferase family 2 protein n=1 Tax=Blastococcus deserti TaxID=2259033 RepID=A0ABW4XBP1_9ACTN